MKLNHITGSSYYLDGESAVGIYIFADNSCLLVDSGPGEARAKKIMDVLHSEGLEIYAIFNTHGHADHCGGNAYIQNQNKCIIMASALSAAVIENPLLGPALLYSAYPLRVLKNRALMPQPSKVNQIIHPGILNIKNKEFVILDLPGHSIGQLGLVNPDGVAYLGDSLMHEESMAGYPFLYMVDIESQIATLEYLAQNNWSQVFLTHGGIVENQKLTVYKNQERIMAIWPIILELLRQPLSREQIVAQMISQLNLPVNTSQYYLVSSTISAFLSYLCQEKRIKARPVKGNMIFSSTEI